MDINFTGKRILVTGAGRGIGRELCKTLASYPSPPTVIAVSKTNANLESLKAECPSIITVQVDLTDWTATRSALASLLPIHCLVNNAAANICQPFLEVTPDTFDSLFNLNVKSVLNVSQAVAKSMIDNGIAGSIVNMSSQASQAAYKDSTVYSATKGALDMMSKVMALELGPHNIRVNCVNPTAVLTDAGRIWWNDPQKGGPMLAQIPLGRFAEVEEVVNAVIFLLSDKASMINGITLPVDGGFLAT